MKTSVSVVLILLMILIGSSGCFLQPVNKVETRFNYIDWNSAVVRLAHPVRAKILISKDGGKTWVSGGTGEIPAGAYVRGGVPVFKTSEIR